MDGESFVLCVTSDGQKILAGGWWRMEDLKALNVGPVAECQSVSKTTLFRMPG